jgi:regulator of replication initiation timing
VKKLEETVSHLRQTVSEKDVEVKIMKRERDEFLNTKLELTLENRRLKVFANQLTL